MELERDPALRELVEDLAESTGTPGVAVGLIADGRAIAATVGVTSTADPLDVDDDTLFMIGSTTKTFTATALMVLVDRGVVSLDDRVIDHLPELRLADPEAAQRVTLGMLLNHTGGWVGDLEMGQGWGDDALGTALDRVAQAPQILPPGEFPSYSNSGFQLAGHLLATVSDTTFEQAVSDLVLDPLGLDHSYFFPWQVAHRRHAVGHVVGDDATTAVSDDLVSRAIAPAGGLWSSVRDQLAYARFHLDGTCDGAAVLAERTRMAMQSPTVEARSGMDGVGVAWLLDHHGDIGLVSHGGNVSNLQTSTFVMAPEVGVAVTVLTNSKFGSRIGQKVLDHALERYCDVGPRPRLDTVAFDADELAGTYDLGQYVWEVTAENGRLYVHMGLVGDASDEVRQAFESSPYEVVAVGTDVFALADSPVAAVLDVRRTEDGRVRGIVHGMRFAPRIDG